MATIDLMYGNHTFSRASSKVTVFVFEGSDRTFPSKAMEKARRGGRNLAARSGDESNGVWYQNHYDARDGLILGISLKTTFNGSPHTDCMLLLRLRHDGPLIQVNANLSKNAEAVYGSLPAFTGRADVITAREATKHFDVLFSPYAYRNLFDKEELEEEFEILTLREGKPRPKLTKVKTPDGKVKKVEISPEPTRKVRLRTRSRRR
jgi:hypothetical protein